MLSEILLSHFYTRWVKDENYPAILIMAFIWQGLRVIMRTDENYRPVNGPKCKLMAVSIFY